MTHAMPYAFVVAAAVRYLFTWIVVALEAHESEQIRVNVCAEKGTQREKEREGEGTCKSFRARGL